MARQQRERPRRNNAARRLANGLGWFSIGLGVAELVAPRQMEKLIGIRDRNKRRNVLRAYGLREIAAGVGILSQPAEPGWMWTRVIGDVLDLATLGSAMGLREANRARMATATVAVAGVTALDVICGARLSRMEPFQGAAAVLVNRPAEDLYNFWRNPANIETLEPLLESVRPLGNQRWRWRANIGGRALEIDTEITEDKPNRLLAWQSAEGSPVKLHIAIEFKPATAHHGTRAIARVEMRGPMVLLAKPASALGLGPELRLEQHLRRFKQLMETGEIARAKPQQTAQPTRRPEPARQTVRESQPEPALAH